MIHVFDDVLADPVAYRAAALRCEFRTYDFNGTVFHGIALGSPALAEWIEARFPTLKSTLSFFRQSPRGQAEPNLIHTDEGMGDWTAILYLNPEPPPEDGTKFYVHDGAVHLVHGWFNRVVLFPAEIPHSRSIPENYGEGDAARLIQVVFGKGQF